MTKRLSEKILQHLVDHTGKSPEQIRPRLSEIRRESSGLTPNAAAQIYAQKHNTSIMAKLDDEDRRSLSSVQSITQVSSSKTIKIDKRAVNINSPVHNLSIGDRSTVNQSVVIVDDSLTELLGKLEKSKKLSEDQKSDYKSDIETLASQIGKKEPNKKIVKLAWESIKALSEVEGFGQLIAHLTSLVHPFIS